MSLVPPTPPLDTSITPGQLGHIADHEAIHDALDNDTASLTSDQTITGKTIYTNFRDKGSQVHDVRAYDAGSAVTTAGIALAVAAAGAEGRIYIPAGTHDAVLVADEIGLVVEADGATLRQTSGATTIAQATADGVTINRLTLEPSGTFTGNLFEGTATDDLTLNELYFNGAAATTSYGYSVLLSGGSDRALLNNCRWVLINGATNRGWDAVAATQAADLSVRGGFIRGGRNRGIDVRSATNASKWARIEGVSIAGLVGHGILIWNGEAIVRGNRVVDCGGAGIFLTGEPGTGDTHYGSVVADNHIIGMGSVGIDLEYEVHECAITGNTVKNTGGNGISLIRACTDNQITGNTVVNADGSYGGIAIPVFGGATSSARNSIVGNTVRDSLHYGIYCEDNPGGLVASNKLYNNADGDYTQNPTYTTDLVAHLSGAGAPGMAAGVGSTYSQTDGGAATSFYVKESGDSTTGWVGK